MDVVAFDRRLEVLDVIGADLVAETARAAVDLHDQIAFLQTHRLGRLWIEDLIDDIDFDEMIAGAERAELRAAALLGALGSPWPDRRLPAARLPPCGANRLRSHSLA